MKPEKVKHQKITPSNTVHLQTIRKKNQERKPNTKEKEKKGGGEELRLSKHLLISHTAQRVMTIPRRLARKHHPTIWAVPPPKEVPFLNVPQQHFLIDQRGVRATLPPALETRGILSYDKDTVTLSHVSVEVDPLNHAIAQNAAVHPPTGVGAVLGRGSNANQPHSIL